MKNRISAIIFSKDIKSYDFSEIEMPVTYREKEETHFEITGYEDSSKIELKLALNRGYDCIVTIGKETDYPELFYMPFDVRKKWVNFETYDAKQIALSILLTFKANINRKGTPKFSIFTCAYKTPHSQALRLYKSLCKQTYTEWNWWILDDSPEGKESYFSQIKDPRITVIKNCTNHGNIGFNKHLIAMACDGDYLVEIDHDDEITPDCLELLKKAFDTYPDCDFVYSHCMEELDGKAIAYDDGFALGLGVNANMDVNGETHYLSLTPDVNVLSMRHIVGMPNHVRCWKSDFYHKIGGHNRELCVMDDADLLIRTFLNGKMCKVPKVLYIQHEGTTKNNDRGATTQAKRFGEILRMGGILKSKYDLDIHNKALNEGYEDPYWNENDNCSYIFDGPKENTHNFNYTLKI